MAVGPLRSMLILILLTTVRISPDYVLPFQDLQTKISVRKTGFPEKNGSVRRLIHPAAFSWECKIQQSPAVRAEIQLVQLQKTLTNTDRKHCLPLLLAPWSLRKILPVYQAVPVYGTNKTPIISTRPNIDSKSAVRLSIMIYINY